MSAVPAVIGGGVGSTASTLTPHIGFSVTSTLMTPLSVTPGYSSYVAVSTACPFPTAAPVYDTVTVVDAPAARAADEADMEQGSRTEAAHEYENLAVAGTPPVFVTVKL